MSKDSEIEIGNLKFIHHKNGTYIIPKEESKAVMSADEMFEELGYIEHYNTEYAEIFRKDSRKSFGR